MVRALVAAVALLRLAVAAGAPAALNPPLPNPILFVTQVPVPGDDVARQTITSSFANHLATTAAAPRGGDLMLLSADGTALRNLTAEAGYGSTGAAGFQDANAIAVRDPAVHWSGGKAIFSMVVGAQTQANGPEDYVWQLYEVTNFGVGQTATIAKVPNQPPFNNIHPNYLSDGSIVFVSDRPRNGAAHLYPINDEYRAQPANSGLWRLDPASGELTLLEHTPSGSFSPFVDSFGRIAFVRWDHLMQDNNHTSATPPFASFDYASEAAGAATQAPLELYPEPIQSVGGSNLSGFEINQFFPWTVNQDGTREEVLNHVGRHELKSAFNRTYTNDASLVAFDATKVTRTNANSLFNFFQMREDPVVPGRYVGVDALDFGTHTAGQILALHAAQGGVLLNADAMTVQYVTNRATSTITANAANIGHFRDPLPMSDGTAASEGTLVAAFSATPGAESAAPPNPVYAFRLNRLSANRLANNNAVNGTNLTAGLFKSVSYYAGANLVAFSGNLWELQPVEVRPHAAPPAALEPALAMPEQQAFADAGVLAPDLREFLVREDLALLVVRNVTTRDRADRQQPFNLRVPGGTAQTLGDAGTIYDVAEMQFFEADQVRGYGMPAAPSPAGRRTMASYLNDAQAVRFNPADAVNPGARPVAADGSVALFVPARRALTWQTLSPSGTAAPLAPNSPVVRERYWIDYQPGEIRACDGCHGVNTTNQAGGAAAANEPQALVALLDYWKQHGDRIFVDGFGP
jgi:hypothetical protein